MRKGFWGASTIAALIKQPKYRGDWTWNRTSWVKKIRGQKRIKRDRPVAEQVPHFSEALRIVLDDLWHSVQPSSRGGQRSMGGKRGHYMLSGILKCAECGSSLVVNNSGKHSCYMCNGYRNGGESVCKNKYRLNRAAAETVFLEELRTVLTNPSVFSQLKVEVESALGRTLQQTTESLASLKPRRRELSRQLEQLLSFVESGDQSQAIRDRIAARENELQEIDEALLRAETAIPPSTEIANGWLDEKLASLSTLFQAKTEHIERLKMELKGLFPDGLVVSGQSNEGGLEFEVAGIAKPLHAALLPTSIMYNSGAGT